MFDKGPQRLTLPLLTAVLMYLSFSKLELWFLLPPALFILSRMKDHVLWLLTGFLFFFSSLLWIRIAMLDYGGVYPYVAYTLIALLSLFLSLYQFSLTHLLWKLARFSPVALPFAWVCVELLRSSFPYGGFPWLITGELLVDFPLLKNYLSAGGVYLGSLLLWFMALSPALIRSRRGLLSLLAVFLLPLPFVRYDYRSPEGVRVALVQPNVSVDIKLDRERFYRTLPAYWSLLDEVIRRKPDLILLPESAFPFTGEELYSEGRRLLRYSESSTLITGIIDVRYEGEWRPYNSVFVLEGGKVRDFYDKVRLLPFGEYVPFPFKFAKDLFGAIAGVDYVPGSEPRCLRAGSISVGTPICFEVSYYWLVRRMALCSDIIAVLTNNGWFRDSDGTFQHLRQARVRAVETRRFVLWVNNTGPSAIVSPEGKVLKTVPYGKRGYVIYDFQE